MCWFSRRLAVGSAGLILFGGIPAFAQPPVNGPGSADTIPANTAPANTAPADPQATFSIGPASQTTPSQNATPQTELVEPATTDPATTRREDYEMIDEMEYGVDVGTSIAEVLTNSEALTLADVTASVYRSYPEIESVRRNYDVADGELLSAWGSFDSKLTGHAISEPTGFYENTRSGLKASRQLWWGGFIEGGYRIGRGFYAPWYLERETETGGEFSIGGKFPLMRGRGINAQQIAVFQSSLDRSAVAPQTQQIVLKISRDAAQAYWKWLAAGQALRIQQDLELVAEKRLKQIQLGFDADKFAEVDVFFAKQLVAERQVLVLTARQDFRESAFKLSLYIRDNDGNPMVPTAEWLPPSFPTIDRDMTRDFQSDLELALSQRPEPRLLGIEIQKLRNTLSLARNDLLPQLDVISSVSQDVGDPATSSDDKGEILLVVGIEGEVPVQRSKARGKIASTNAKIAQTELKIQLAKNKLATELQIAFNALQIAAESIRQSELAVDAAFETLEINRFAFNTGAQKVDLLKLNILEEKAFESEVKLVKQIGKWYSELAALQAALGMDPLDAAIAISARGPYDITEFNQPTWTPAEVDGPAADENLPQQ